MRSVGGNGITGKNARKHSDKKTVDPSEAGLPYLVNEYDYRCFSETLETANNEYQKIDPLLRGYFTLNKNLEHINLISDEEALKRQKEFLKNHNQ